MRIQPKLKKPRTKVPSFLQKELEAAVERDSLRWDCSKSWIIATALAAFYGIDIMKPYVEDKRKHLALIKKRA